MINEYQIEYSDLLFATVTGNAFHYLDLYEIVGQHKFITTFMLKAGSNAHNVYGPSITGFVSYDFKSLQELKKENRDLSELDINTIKIHSTDSGIDQTSQSELKYGGIKISDLESISFLNYKNESETHDTGEKKVPNIIEIPIDTAGIDADRLCLTYLTVKNRDGVALAPYEKEKLIGLTLGMNNGRIDSRLLGQLGFDKASIQNNLNIFGHFYRIKESKGPLSEKEKESYADIKDIHNMAALTKILKELVESAATNDELTAYQTNMKELIDLALAFRPHVLLHGKKQIYWDLDSYLHIVMRHTEKFQVGKFTGKSRLPYKIKDLEDLIGQVLKRIEDEYEAHSTQRPESIFSRRGTMGVEFNGEHYNLTVEPDGRLSQFHPRGSVS